MRFLSAFVLVLLVTGGCATGPDQPRGALDLSDDPGPSPSQVRPDVSHRLGPVGGFRGAGPDAAPDATLGAGAEGGSGGIGMPGS